jgi:hypothetical protein
MPNAHDGSFVPGPLEGEPLDSEAYQGYVSTAQAQRHARAVAMQAAQNGHAQPPPETDQGEPTQEPAPPQIAPDPRMRRTTLTPPAGQLGDRELAEWSRGAVLGIALGCVVGVGIAYLLVSRIEREDSGAEK